MAKKWTLDAAASARQEAQQLDEQGRQEDLAVQRVVEEIVGNLGGSDQYNIEVDKNLIIIGSESDSTYHQLEKLFQSNGLESYVDTQRSARKPARLIVNLGEGNYEPNLEKVVKDSRNVALTNTLTALAERQSGADPEEKVATVRAMLEYAREFVDELAQRKQGEKPEATVGGGVAVTRAFPQSRAYGVE